MFWSEYYRRFTGLAMNILGPETLVGPDGDGYRPGRWARTHLGALSNTIWGGTAEVQRNIVGERALGLPRGFGGEHEAGAQGRDPIDAQRRRIVRTPESEKEPRASRDDTGGVVG